MPRLAAVPLGLVLLLMSASALAEVPISDEARAHFNAGVSFLQDPDGARYEEAYREFRTAYTASPSWKILGNLGIAAFKLERDGEAIDAFTKYLSEGGTQIEADERAQVGRDLATVQAASALVKLESDPAGATLLDERIPTTGAAIRNRYNALNQPTELALRAGHHRITAKLEGHADVVWEVDLEPRQQLTQVLRFEPGAPAQGEKKNSGMRTASYVALGVGAVGLGLGTVFGLNAKSKYDSANELCPSSPCPLTRTQADQRSQLGKDGDSAKTLSLVGFIAGGVGVAAGVTLFILSSKKTEQPAHATLAPYMTLGSAGFVGSFQ